MMKINNYALLVSAVVLGLGVSQSVVAGQVVGAPTGCPATATQAAMQGFTLTGSYGGSLTYAQLDADSAGVFCEYTTGAFSYTPPSGATITPSQLQVTQGIWASEGGGWGCGYSSGCQFSVLQP